MSVPWREKGKRYSLQWANVKSLSTLKMEYDDVLRCAFPGPFRVYYTLSMYMGEPPYSKSTYLMECYKEKGDMLLTTFSQQ